MAAYLALSPPAADLAAATYRSDLFARVGFSAWDSGWYAAHGHWLPAYSLLSPALGALLGVRTLLAVSAVAASVLFGLIAARAFGTGAAARLSAGVFALGACVGLLSGRVPFDLGLAIGLGSVLALTYDRPALALGLAALTSVASPVAGAFLALAGLAYATLSPRRGLGLAAVALAPALALSLAYPEGGHEPFAPSAFWPALVGVTLFAALVPRGPLADGQRRMLRAGAALYALALTAAFAIPTPMGGNAARLGPLLAAPLLAGVLWDRRGVWHRRGVWDRRGEAPPPGDQRRRSLGDGRVALVALAPALLYWQLATPIRDLAQVAGDPSVKAAYYAPLRAELRTLRLRRPATSDGRDATGSGHDAPIVEVPLTKAHWEAAYLAGHEGIRLARGWERQLDTRYGALFYEPHLSALAYERWLRENRVSYVALPDAPLDKAGRAEGKLVAAGVPYLREIWHSAHWRLYDFIG